MDTPAGQLRDPAALQDLGARWLLGRRACALDVQAHSLLMDDGALLRYSSVVVATGVLPRRPPFARGVDGVHVLRTLDEAVALRADLQNAERVVVIGSGVLGCEVTACARQGGAQVCVLGTGAPMASRLGVLLAGAVTDLHTCHGTVVRTGVEVAGLQQGSGGVRAVVLDGGGRRCCGRRRGRRGLGPRHRVAAGQWLGLGRWAPL